MPTTSFLLADRALDGELAARLTAWRNARVSYRAIARILNNEGIEVSRSVVARWCQDIDTEAQAS
jgi:transposase-like protein